jgi:hypothetical protein
MENHDPIGDKTGMLAFAMRNPIRPVSRICKSNPMSRWVGFAGTSPERAERRLLASTEERPARESCSPHSVSRRSCGENAKQSQRCASLVNFLVSREARGSQDTGETNLRNKPNGNLGKINRLHQIGSPRPSLASLKHASTHGSRRMRNEPNLKRLATNTFIFQIYSSNTSERPGCGAHGRLGVVWPGPIDAGTGAVVRTRAWRYDVRVRIFASEKTNGLHRT